MPLASFAPSAAVNLRVSTISANVELPATGSPTTAVVTNLGEHVSFVALGADDTTVASASSSMAVMPGRTVSLTIGSNTYLAGVTLNGVSQLNIAVGN